jgi:hypothetical protein
MCTKDCSCDSIKTNPTIRMQLHRRGGEGSIVLYETKDLKKNLKPVEYERQSGLLMEGATDDQNSFILC